MRSFLTKSLLFLFLCCMGTSYRLFEGSLPFTVSIQEIAVYLLFFYFILRGKNDGRIPLDQPLTKILIVYFISLIGVALVHFGSAPTHSLSVIRDNIVPIMTLVLLTQLLVEVSVDTIVRMLIVVVWISIVIGMLQSLFGIFTMQVDLGNRDIAELLDVGGSGGGSIATGLFSHWNAFSLFLHLLTVIIFSQGLLKKKPIYFVTCLFTILVVYMSSAKTGLALTVLGYILVYLIFAQSKTLWRMAAVLFAATILALVLVVDWKALMESKLMYTFVGRLYLWSVGTEVLIENPGMMIFGYGSGTFMDVTGLDYTAHNIYLLHIFEEGVVPFVLLLVLVGTIARTYMRERDPFAKSILLSLLLYFAHEFVEHSFNSIIFKIIIAFIVVMYYKVRHLQTDTVTDAGVGAQPSGRPAAA